MSARWAAAFSETRFPNQWSRSQLVVLLSQFVSILSQLVVTLSKSMVTFPISGLTFPISGHAFPISGVPFPISNHTSQFVVRPSRVSAIISESSLQLKFASACQLHLGAAPSNR